MECEDKCEPKDCEKKVCEPEVKADTPPPAEPCGEEKAAEPATAES